MFAQERQGRISSQLVQLGQVSVQELAEQFSVTTETIRRDLDQLESTGSLVRVHGGAVSAERTSLAEPSLSERGLRNQAQKQRIAAAALKFLPHGASASVLLDAGTTTELFASQLVERTTGPNLAITNAVPIAARLSASAHVELELLGGRVRGLTSAAVGARVVSALNSLRVDVAFIGANGVHQSFGLSTPDSAEAAVKSAMVSSARLVVALVDSSKLGAEALVSFASLEQLDVLVTDQAPAAALADALRAADVEVVIA